MGLDIGPYGTLFTQCQKAFGSVIVSEIVWQIPSEPIGYTGDERFKSAALEMQARIADFVLKLQGGDETLPIEGVACVVPEHEMAPRVNELME